VCVCVSVPSSVTRRYYNPLYLQCIGKRGHNNKGHDTQNVMYVIKF